LLIIATSPRPRQARFEKILVDLTGDTEAREYLGEDDIVRLLKITAGVKLAGQKAARAVRELALCSNAIRRASERLLGAGGWYLIRCR
jgi:hypothetical protein